MTNNILITREVIRQKWHFFAAELGIPEEDWLTLSPGWLTKYKARMGLKEYKRHSEAASADVETVEREQRHMKGVKLRLTYALTANADGTDKLQPLVIGKYRQPRAFNKKSAAAHGFLYRHNPKVWMTTVLYQEWIRDWNEELRRKGRHVLLLQDNFSGHAVPAGLTNIRVENFEPNLTSHVQPNNQGIIRCFKAHYRAAYIERAIARYDQGITPSSIYDINQLQAMRLADIDWWQVNTTTLRNCWKKAQILPEFTSPTRSQPSVPVSSLLDGDADPLLHAKKVVEVALDALQATGTLQRVNRMDLTELLNPEVEQGLASRMSDAEIVEMVMVESRGGEESVGAEGARDEDDEDGPIELPPTCKEVLEATAVIGRCLDNMDSMLAQKLEVMLASLTRQMRVEASQQLETSKITDFFTRSSSE
ncbi:DDE-domain-containing protein [Coniophora puteana RWD-64-598 SS2]|uniref:DDE-domain-containing protein n=1 Tax=Coniophora puteana (strain RWD-64-598) TaxID=741705 RepID=A0A5M3MV44_CONPW|nr:DDE-domain-containing protein [Coniophora puteana RWD-64-598 SS2]EIW82986.1 DDE-domain-containing protein [Coniophora puteana RWD-64-598 SS2]